MDRTNIYDMTRTCELGANKFFERVGKGKYRQLKSLGGDYTMVTDKKLIARLDKIFKGVQDDDAK